MLQPGRRAVPSQRFDTDVDADLDVSYRNLAAAVLRQALDDLAVARERARARGFLLHHYSESVLGDWLGCVRPAVMARAIRVGVRRRPGHDRPRAHRRIDTTEAPGAGA